MSTFHLIDLEYMARVAKVNMGTPLIDGIWRYEEDAHAYKKGFKWKAYLYHSDYVEYEQMLGFYYRTNGISFAGAVEVPKGKIRSVIYLMSETEIMLLKLVV